MGQFLFHPLHSLPSAWSSVFICWGSMKLAEVLPVGVEFHFVSIPPEGMQQFSGIMVWALNQR